MLLSVDSEYVLEHLVLIDQFDPGCRTPRLELGTQGVEDGSHVRVDALQIVAGSDVIVPMVTSRRGKRNKISPSSSLLFIIIGGLATLQYIFRASGNDRR